MKLLYYEILLILFLILYKNSVLKINCELSIVDGKVPERLKFQKIFQKNKHFEKQENTNKREISTQQYEAMGFQPIRIQLHYDDSESFLTIEQRNHIKNELTPQALLYFKQLLSVQKLQQPILLDRYCNETELIVQSGNGNTLRACSKDCSNTDTYCGTALVPNEHLKRCIICTSNNCQYSNNTPTDGPGVSNADFLLYVTAVDTNCDDKLGYSKFCAIDSETDRPTVGYINLCPTGFQADEATVIYTLKHELLHTFGFDSDLFAFFRDKQSNPLTERTKSGYPSTDSYGNFIPSKSTVNTYSYKWQTAYGIKRHEVTLLTTPRVRDEVRSHFNCDTAEGAELENQDVTTGQISSHLEKRVFENEIMTSIISPYPVLSRITLAVLEDSGWYRVNYSKAEPYDWGRNQGCAFIQESCLSYYLSNHGNQQNPFCLDGTKDIGCSADRKLIAICNNRNFNNALPIEYQYYNTTSVLGGGRVEADYCPYYQGSLQDDCTKHTSTLTKIDIFKFGQNSRCFNHEGGVLKENIYKETQSYKLGGGCYEYYCNRTGVYFVINNTIYSCIKNVNKDVIVDQEINGNVWKLKIKCPTCEDACWDRIESCQNISLNGAYPIKINAIVIIIILILMSIIIIH